MPHRYAKEKLSRIVYALATREGDVRDRLKAAYRDIRILTPEDVPPGMQSDLQEVKDWLVRYGPERYRGQLVQSALEHTLRRSRNGTARRIAEKLYAMNRRIRSR